MDTVKKKYAVATGISRPYLAMFALFLLYSTVSQYPLLVIIGGAIFSVIAKTFLQDVFLPVIFYCFGYQWLQVFTIILYADTRGQSLTYTYGIEHPGFLLVMTMLQVMMMALVVKTFLVKVNFTRETFVNASKKIDDKKVIYAYLGCVVAFPVLFSVVGGSASLAQLVEALSLLKKVVVVILIFLLFIKDSKYKTWIIAILLLEFILGFVTYFSSFKDVILYTALVSVSVHAKLKKGLFKKLLPLIIFMVGLISFWSYVKYDYRNFLNGGNRHQQVLVSKDDALNFLWERLKSFDGSGFNTGIQITLSRIQYMEEYLLVYQRVPAIIPHANGGDVLSALDFLFTPRSWNENKKRLDPSEKTNFYTGIHHADAAQGTSISMGYFCDLYIDFGTFGMLIPLIIIALIIVAICNHILKSKQYNVLFSYSLLIALIMSLGTFESDIIFYLGSIRNYIIVLLLGNWIIFPKLNKYIRA